MTKLEKIAMCSASTIGRALAAGKISSTDLTGYLLEKVGQHSASNVFISITPERAIAEAKAADKRLRAGQPLSPLDGVPLVWKDLFDMSGEVTTAGSKTYLHAPTATADAEVLANATAAGMVSIGKVNLSEFAFSGLGLNPHFGTPTNPFDMSTPRIPGGSSSGTAVAVAMGFVPCGIGTDTGGSVRIPAALNGLVGYKPSEGRMSKVGVFPLSQTLDVVGPIARSVEDCIHLDGVLQGRISSPVRRAPIVGTNVFIPNEIVFDGIAPQVEANFHKSIALLEAAGARIIREPSNLFHKANKLIRGHGTIVAAEAYAEHHDLIEAGQTDKIDSRVVQRILGGKKMTAYDLLRLQRGRLQLISELTDLLGDGLLAMPTTAITAPEIAPLEKDDDLFHETNSKMLRNTGFGNFFNMPGLALPNGRDANGLPTSLLISTVSGSDNRLFELGLDVEKIINNSMIPTRAYITH